MTVAGVHEPACGARAGALETRKPRTGLPLLDSITEREGVGGGAAMAPLPAAAAGTRCLSTRRGLENGAVSGRSHVAVAAAAVRQGWGRGPCALSLRVSRVGTRPPPVNQPAVRPLPFCLLAPTAPLSRTRSKPAAGGGTARPTVVPPATARKASEANEDATLVRAPLCGGPPRGDVCGAGACCLGDPQSDAHLHRSHAHPPALPPPRHSSLTPLQPLLSIWFGSQTGTAEGYAKGLAKAAAKHGFR